MVSSGIKSTFNIVLFTPSHRSYSWRHNSTAINYWRRGFHGTNVKGVQFQGVGRSHRSHWQSQNVCRNPQSFSCRSPRRRQRFEFAFEATVESCQGMFSVRLAFTRRPIYSVTTCTIILAQEMALGFLWTKIYRPRGQFFTESCSLCREDSAQGRSPKFDS